MVDWSTAHLVTLGPAITTTYLGRVTVRALPHQAGWRNNKTFREIPDGGSRAPQIRVAHASSRFSLAMTCTACECDGEIQECRVVREFVLFFCQKSAFAQVGAMTPASWMTADESPPRRHRLPRHARTAGWAANSRSTHRAPFEKKEEAKYVYSLSRFSVPGA